VIGYPWVHVKKARGMRDDIQFDLLFRYFKEDLGMPPVRCQHCWKVVVRPRTVVELFKLLELQERIKDKVYGCKCGVEDRPNVNSLYGGYIYCRSKDEGLDTYKLVRKEVDKSINKNINVFLKRGCTEMEVTFGDPDKWFYNDAQKKVEQFILSKFDMPDFDIQDQPKVAQEHIKPTWVEVACAYGDQTYRQLTDSPMHTEYKHYEQEGNK